MIQKFKAWCNKPYFLIDNLNIKLSMVLGVGLFTYLFLFIFQPFGVDQVVKVNHFLILGYGLLVSFSLFISYFVLPKVFSFYFNVRNWTVQKEASFLLVSFLIISTTNYFYHSLFVEDYLPNFSFLRFVSVVFSIGIFPVLFIIFMVERYLYRKHNTNPTEFIEEIRKEKKEYITIPSDNIKVEPLVLDIDTILYAQSNNNYTTIVYKVDASKTKQELIRITLKKVNEILEPYPQFIRCHRSFLINKKQIIKVDGNARASQVQLKLVTEMIPVSRSFPNENLTS